MVSFLVSVWMSSFQQPRKALIPLSHVKLFDRGQSCKFTISILLDQVLSARCPNIDIHKLIRSLLDESPDTRERNSLLHWTEAVVLGPLLNIIRYIDICPSLN